MKKNADIIKGILYRTTAMLLALLMLLPVTAFASEKKNTGMIPVTYDESLYVTLDHYGNREHLSIVKGVDLNGNKSFTDYGFYAKVQNMSGYEKPALTPEGVVWNLDEYQKNRIYFECTPKDESTVALPWNFKVGYKLNGVPIKAEALAGKSGMVEIIAECEANPDVNDYMKNNMLLQLVTLVDTESILSVEADGAQTQAIGKYKAVIFAALPGESTTFHIRIGTESFASLGLIMMMEPATLAQMEQLKELREVKETLGDAPAILLNGMSSMLQSVGGISDSLGQAGQGIDSLKNAYANMQDYSSDIIASSGEAVAAFSALSRDLSALMPYVDSTSQHITVLKEVLARLKENVGDDPALMTGLQLNAALVSSEAEFQKANASMSELNTEVGKLNLLASAVHADLSNRPELAAEGDDLGTILEDLENLVKNLNTVLEMISQQKEAIEKILATLENLADAIQNPELIATVEELLSTLDGALRQAGRAGEQLVKVTGACASLFSALTNAISSSSSDLNTGMNKILDGLSGAANGAAGISSSSSQLQGVGNTLQNAIDKVLNQFTEGNNLLNIDANARRQSMTSEKNASPSSVQIVLRTETIGLELMNEADADDNHVAQTPWARIKQVFAKIWKAIQTLFE